MTVDFRLRRTFQQSLKRFTNADQGPRFPALLGKGFGDTDDATVSDRPGWVYVRVGGERLLAQAFNQCVLPRNDQAVIVGFRREQPGLFQVLSLREVYTPTETDDCFVPQIVSHHEIHELKNDIGGDDTVWVTTQQITELLVCPTDPVSLQVKIMPGLYPWSGSYQYFDGVTSGSLSGYVPSSSANSRVVVLSLNGDTNLIQYTSGETYPTDWPPADFDDKIPAAPSGDIPLGGVILAGSTTTINWDELLDLRLWVQVSGGGGGTGSCAHVVGGLESEIDFRLNQLHLGVPSSNARRVLNQILGHIEDERDLQISKHVVEGV